MPDATQTSLAVAYRHIDDKDTTEAEVEAILSAMATHLDGEEGETASRALHHLREYKGLQMQLQGLICKGA